MSAYDPYDAPPREHPREHSRRYYREERRDGREPRYVDTQETYLGVSPSSRTQLIPRAREDSDLSIEEVRRDFPPLGSSTRDVRRTRSAEPGYYDDYYDPHRDYDSRSYRDRRPGKKAGSVYYEEEERTRKRVLNQQEKIIAAVVSGVLVAGAKEVWDRHEAKQAGREVDRDAMTSAALGAAGAFAGYQGADYYNKHTSKEEKTSSYVVHKGRNGRVSEYYSDEDEDLKSHRGNKSFLESALSAAGLGGAIKALTGGGDDDRRDRGRYDDDRSVTRSRRGSLDSRKSRNDGANRMQKAAKASLVAGAAEAFRVAKEPGGWKGEKMKRILTVAAGAATIDAAQDPNKDSKMHLFESVVGGLLGNRMLNGSRKEIEEDRKTGRSRSRSRARSEGVSGGNGLAALATAGLGALAGKKLLDKRDDSRGRRDSFDSYESRDGSPRRRQRSRSRSVVDGARRSLAKIGIGSGPSDDRDDYDDSRSARRSRRTRSPDDRYDDDFASRGPYMRGAMGDADYYEDDRSTVQSGRRRRSRSRGGRSASVSSSDLGDSDEDEKEARKRKGKQIITTGLATVATIHAAHNVYQSMEKRNTRHKAVKEGRLSPTEAKKLKSKALLQDAASVGIAAMGIKGAISEMKEAREISHEVKEWQEEKKRRHDRRMERLRRANDDHYRSQSRSDDWATSPPPRASRYDDEPRYLDGNPYSSLPTPPAGYSDRR